MCPFYRWSGARAMLARAESHAGLQGDAWGATVRPAAVDWLRPLRPAEYLYLSINVFPLETSIFLERLPLERERYKKKIAWRKIALAIDRYFFWSLWPF